MKISFVRIILSLSALVLFYSCSPKVTRDVREVLPKPHTQDNITIYEEKDKKPLDPRILEDITIDGGSFTTNCDEEDLMRILKRDAKRIGANGIIIAEHKYPDSESHCHRMYALLVYVDKAAEAQKSKIQDSLATTAISDKPQTGNSENIPLVKTGSGHEEIIDYTMPRDSTTKHFFFAAGGLYSYRIARMADNVDRDMAKHVDAMRSSYGFQADAAYLTKNSYGFGINAGYVVASHYATNAVIQLNDNTFYSYDNTIGVFHIVPSVYFHKIIGDFILSGSAGFGYFSYREEVKPDNSNTLRIEASNYCMLYNVSGGYNLTPSLSLLARLSFFSGEFSSFTFDDGYYKQEFSMEKNESNNLGRIDIGLGLAFRF